MSSTALAFTTPMAPAKVARPRLAEVYHCQRLHGWLDAAAQRAQVLWIEGPPGSGKTTLAGSWLNAGKRPCLWYHVDPGDNDPATFFHYLGLAAKFAAPRRKHPLPHLTPEYLASVEMFARRYFEQLSQWLPADAVIVFDNIQELGPDSRLYDVLRAGFEHLPNNIHVLCLSRGALPSSLARLHVGGQLACLTAQALELTLEEAAGVAGSHSAGMRADIAQIHEKTHGWVAGLVLMLEQQPGRPTSLPLDKEATPQALFAYFAGEVLRHLDLSVRAGLMQSALLPKMHAADVDAMWGYVEMGRVLADLQQKNYFTYRLSAREPVYEYHPLFREFLLARLYETHAPAALVRLQQQAAELLDARGDIEAAVALRMQAHDWSGIARTIETHAATLLEQGRWQQLTLWLNALPEDSFERSPLLFYWDGMSRLAVDPVVARVSLGRAYQRLMRAGDSKGAYSAWISVIDSFVFEWSDFTPLRPWVDEFEQLRRTFPIFPTEDIEHQVTIAIFVGLMHAKATSPELPVWAERVEQMIPTLTDPLLCIKAMTHLSMYYSMWVVDQAKFGALTRSFGALVNRPGVPPLARITWYALSVTYYLNAAEFGACLDNTAEGLQLAESHGIHLWDTILCFGGTIAALEQGDPATAERYLQRMSQVFKSQRRIDSVWYYGARALWHITRAEFQMARADLELSLSVGENTGFFVGEALALVGLVRFSVRAGDLVTAETLLQRTQAAVRQGNSQFADYRVKVVEAEIALATNDENRCLRALREFLSLAARGGIWGHVFWNSEAMARLYATALEHDIQVDYVRAVIQKRRILPPLHTVSEQWPWPIRLYTLGRFALVRDGEPVSFSGKAQKKPIDLLKILIAQGGRNVSANLLHALLWPDGETDAESLFRTTLHRLRKLLGYDEVLVVEDGKVSLDPRYCWVDVWVFDRSSRQIRGLLMDKSASATDPEQMEHLARQALRLYQGHFLGREAVPDWAHTLRDRLASQFRHDVSTLCSYWEGRQAWDDAADVYGRALELDNLAEEFYCGLMRCQAALGNFSAAVNTYRRCRQALSVVLGISPSAQTEALYATVRTQAQ